jgi:ABC-type phosphate/phosphonate transport system substrate-binding protein
VRRLVLALAALGLIAAAPPPPFRIGVLEPASGPCAPAPPSASAGERAYLSLLTKRLDRPVLACPVASLTEGAAALAAGRLDMTVLDGPSYSPVRAAVRAAMTVRPQNGLTRPPVALVVKSGRDGSAASLKGGTVVFGGSTTVALALPRETLSEQGYGPAVFAREVVADDETTALAALRAGKADAAALEAAAWQRQCQDTHAKTQPCADLKLVWRARPQAQRAWAVRRDLPDPFRFRLLGMHMAMHLEDKPAFAWAASQLSSNAADFQPAEAQALEAARLP